MPSISAASEIPSPTKNRSLISSALSGSSPANFASASCTRKSSSGPVSMAMSISSRLRRSCGPPRLSRCLRRAWIHQNPAHGLGGGGEEIPAVFPWVVLLGNSQPGFVNQSRGLQSVSGRLCRHLGGRPAAQLFINQRQEFCGNLRVSFLDSVEQLSDVGGHVPKLSLPDQIVQSEQSMVSNGAFDSVVDSQGQ